ncbi:hypothetical protein J6590_000083 [Homalodisca vitripennis]|nr:hypothetical protein J6590_000083 [Homalodisca vitripennis]
MPQQPSCHSIRAELWEHSVFCTYTQETLLRQFQNPHHYHASDFLFPHSYRPSHTPTTLPTLLLPFPHFFHASPSLDGARLTWSNFRSSSGVSGSWPRTRGGLMLTSLPRERTTSSRLYRSANTQDAERDVWSGQIEPDRIFDQDLLVAQFQRPVGKNENEKKCDGLLVGGGGEGRHKGRVIH